MLKFVLLSVLCGVSLAMNVENTGENVENTGENVENTGEDVENTAEDVENTGEDVENTAEDLNLLARGAGCAKNGCKQTRKCRKPANAEGLCTNDLQGCKTKCIDFYEANNNHCKTGCHCMKKCRPMDECSNIGGYCVRRGQGCKSCYTEKPCGCKTKKKCSCCVPDAKASQLTC